MRLRSVDRKILRIALPAIVSNITVPLLSMVDTAIVGHMGATAYIGAIAIAGTVFSVVYWIFGFLRASTSGLTSQALGVSDDRQVENHFVRSAFFAIGIAALLLAFQRPLWKGTLLLMGTSPEVESIAWRYFSICIWGAPAVMLVRAYNGWFLGMQNTRIPMLVSIMQNIVNIPVSLILVFVCGWDVCGVALGTIIAQYAGLFLAAFLRRKYFRRYCLLRVTRGVFVWKEMKRFLSVNRDIFFRTICLVAVTVFFTVMGARQGDEVLAANTLLLQFFYIFSYVMDGFSNAGEALCGKSYGAGRIREMRIVVKVLFQWGVRMVILFTLVYVVGGHMFLRLLTDESQVLLVAFQYWWWTLLVPLCGFSAFLWDGIYVGTTSTRSMLLSMLVAVVVFFVCWFAGKDWLGNHALWISFLMYLLSRGWMQSLLFGRIVCWASIQRNNYGPLTRK